MLLQTQKYSLTTTQLQIVYRRLCIFCLFFVLVVNRCLSAQNFIYIKFSEFQNTFIGNAKEQIRYLVTDTGDVLLSKRVFDSFGILSRLDSFALTKNGYSRVSWKTYKYIKSEKQLTIKSGIIEGKTDLTQELYFDTIGVMIKRIRTDEISGFKLTQDFKKSAYGVYTSIETLTEGGSNFDKYIDYPSVSVNGLSKNIFRIYEPNETNQFSIEERYNGKINRISSYGKSTGKLERKASPYFYEQYSYSRRGNLVKIIEYPTNHSFSQRSRKDVRNFYKTGRPFIASYDKKLVTILKYRKHNKLKSIKKKYMYKAILNFWHYKQVNSFDKKGIIKRTDIKIILLKESKLHTI